jgi:large subunit ribosomal protein L6
MSRIANSPVELPQGVDVSIAGADISVKGAKGSLSMKLHKAVQVQQDGNVLNVVSNGKDKNSGSSMILLSPISGEGI